MFTQNEYAMMRVNQDAYDSAFQEAEKLRMLRRAGLLQSGKLPQMACRGLINLGQLLISVGKRLEGAASPA